MLSNDVTELRFCSPDVSELWKRKYITDTYVHGCYEFRIIKMAHTADF